MSTRQSGCPPPRSTSARRASRRPRSTALAGGVLKARFANLGAYGGQASGDLIVDASAASPTYTLRCDLAGVRALPLLLSAADFDKLDGRLQAKMALRSAG